MLPLADFCSYYAPIRQLRRTAAGAAAREQEPVDKDAFTVVLRVVREQAVVGVLLLAETVAAAATRLGALADLLMDGLWKVFGVDDSPDLARRVGCPVGRDDRHFGLATVHPSVSPSVPLLLRPI